jgi:vacuolar-type H+-ATPase subunit H
VNDYGKSQNDKAQQDEQAHELIEQLNLLEAADRRITPEHIARRFGELLDDLGDDCPPGGGPGGHLPVIFDQPGLDSQLAGLLQKSIAESCAELPGFSGSLDAAIAAARGAAADIIAAAQAKAKEAAGHLVREAVTAACQQTEQIVAGAHAEADKALEQAVKMVRDARDQADRIVSEARDQAAQTLTAARVEADRALEEAVKMVRDARDQADRIVSEARDQAAQTVTAARNEHAHQNALVWDAVALDSLAAPAELLVEDASFAESCMKAGIRFPHGPAFTWLTDLRRETDASKRSLTAAATTDGHASFLYLQDSAYLEVPAARRDQGGVLVFGEAGIGTSALLGYLSAQESGSNLPEHVTEVVSAPADGHGAHGWFKSLVGKPIQPKSQMAAKNCTIVLSDVVGFGADSRTDEDRRIVREALFSMTHAVLRDLPDAWSWDDRGDGFLTVVSPSVPTAKVIAHLHKDLPAALEEHNRAYPDSARIQLRVAIHVGPVASGRMGISGQAIIITARLVEAPVLKQAMSESGASLGIVASAFIYESVLRHGPYLEGYSKISVPVKETSTAAWVKLFDATRSLLADDESLTIGYGEVSGREEPAPSRRELTG